MGPVSATLENISNLLDIYKTDDETPSVPHPECARRQLKLSSVLKSNPTAL